MNIVYKTQDIKFLQVFKTENNTKNNTVTTVCGLETSEGTYNIITRRYRNCSDAKLAIIAQEHIAILTNNITEGIPKSSCPATVSQPYSRRGFIKSMDKAIKTRAFKGVINITEQVVKCYEKHKTIISEIRNSLKEDISTFCITNLRQVVIDQQEQFKLLMTRIEDVNIALTQKDFKYCEEHEHHGGMKLSRAYQKNLLTINKKMCDALLDVMGRKENRTIY